MTKRTQKEKAEQEIVLDAGGKHPGEGKNFLYLVGRTCRLPDDLPKTLQTIIRDQVEKGKDTLLIRSGASGTGTVAGCFHALRAEYPDLRLIHVSSVAEEDGLSDRGDSILALKNKDRRAYGGMKGMRGFSPDEFIISRSSAVICCLTGAMYKRSVLARCAEQAPDLEVVNLYRPLLNSGFENDLTDLLKGGERMPWEIAERLAGWDPDIPAFWHVRTGQFKHVLEAFILEYADSPERLREMSNKLLASFFYYAYCLGITEKE